MIGKIVNSFSREYIQKNVIGAVCVGAISYMGRSYFKINPLYASLFVFVANIAYKVGLELTKIKENQVLSRNEAFSKRAIFVTVINIPHALAIISGVFSPLQMITVMGLQLLPMRFLITPLSLFPTNKSTE